MKKNLRFPKVILLCLSVATIACAGYYYYNQPASDEDFGGVAGEHEESTKAADDPIARAEYEFNLVKNPETGRIPEGVITASLTQAQEIYARQQAMRVTANTYSVQGPNNLGGRTRTVAYDVRFNGTSNQVILAGGVSGGVYKSIDNGATWVRKSPTNQLYSVTSLAQDPRPGFQDTWYYSTGELIGNSAGGVGAFYYGNGIYKSTNNGETWTRQPNSNLGALETFDVAQDFTMKVAVNPANGHVYIGCLYGIYRSTDGGSTWSTALLSSGSAFISSNQITDLVINSTGTRFYASFGGLSCTTSDGCPTNNVPGVWTSTTGDAGSWTKIAGDGAATNPVGWDVNGSYRRVVLAIAPSNENILYALYDDGDVFPNIEGELYRWDQSLTTWTNLSANLPDEVGGSSGNDPFAVQTGYDLVVAVKPDNENVVFIGGTNVYRSTDGFTTTTNYTRIGGYAGPSTYALYASSHPDIHSFVFQPGNPSIMICGNDGGVQRTTNNLAATVAWTDISTGYNTYQFYHVAIDPRNANGKVIGGAQDNGSTRNIGGTGTSFELVYGGDGVSVGLTDVLTGNTYEIVGSQAGDVRRRNSTSALGATSNIRPSAATGNGLFVTLFKLDVDNTLNLYYVSDSSLYRNTSVPTATTANWTAMTGVPTTIVDGGPVRTQISALATTRGTYSAATASLFIGTNERRLYRLDDPVNAAAATVPVDITGAGFPAGANISSIAVNPRNDDTVIVTFSNYGVASVFWTGNANSATPTWLNVEGTLTLPSYRSSAIAITNDGVEYFVGTSVGLFKATINAASPGATAWTQEGAAELGNASVVSMALRTVDNRLLIGTHGYGMWATTLTGAGLPVQFTSFTGKVEDKQNRLFWKVENEVDNKGYEIQRKYKNETNFTRIGFVPAKSANAQANEYAFPDGLVDLGIDNVSYRLKQIDIDGDFQYSTTITLTRKISGKLVEYMTPRGSTLLLRVNGQTNQPLTFRLFDNSGKLVAQKQIQHQTQVVSMPGLPAGVFVVELSHPDGRRHTQKVMF